MVEVARLESVYRFIAYPGFESPSLRQNTKAPNGAFFISSEARLRAQGIRRVRLASRTAACRSGRADIPARRGYAVNGSDRRNGKGSISDGARGIEM